MKLKEALKKRDQALSDFQDFIGTCLKEGQPEILYIDVVTITAKLLKSRELRQIIARDIKGLPVA